MKVIGFGDNVVDRYINQNVYYPGGNALNFAVYAKKCGAESAYLGVFAADKEADWIKFTLTDIGVDFSYCPTMPGTTTERFDVILSGAERVFVGDDLRTTKPSPMVLMNREIEYLKQFLLIHSGCYAGVEDEIAKLECTGSLISFDFSEEDIYRTDAYLKNICPHLDMALFSCAGLSEREIYALQERVFQMGTKYVLTTMGLNGQILFDGRNRYRGRAEAGKSVDTMGAGDSFYAAFITELLKNRWRKNGNLTEALIKQAFSKAAAFSAEMCGIHGSFGFGARIE